MIAFVEGIVDEVGEDFVIIDTDMGIGYEVSLAAESDLLKSMQKGEKVKLYTSQYFRENDQGLFGFKNSQQRNFYELLITVSGVGPKLASTLIAHIEPAKLAGMIVSNDTESIMEVPGIGKKMSERLIVDLRDRVLGEGFVSKSQLEGDGEVGTQVGADSANEDEMMFLEQALQKLGFGTSEINSMKKDAEGMISSGSSVEDVLRKLLEGGKDN
jgi:Holliday junction DNA helicase RuvA